MNPGNLCVTCGGQLAGPFCHHCGEKRAEDRDLTLRAFLQYAAEALTNADAKLYVTLRRLFLRPGLLTSEFVAGRRNMYVSPLQLFLISNLLYFVLLQMGMGADTFTTDLAWHRTQPIYGPVAESMIQERAGPLPERGIDQPAATWLASWSEEQQELRTRFNEASPRYANSMVILMIPLFALVLRMLRVRSLFVRDLVFSIHFFAFLLFFSLMFALAVGAVLMMLIHGARLTGLANQPLVIAAFEWIDWMSASELMVALIIIAPTLLYLVLAIRRAYGDGLPAALLRSVAALVLLFMVLTTYRAILFFVVFWAV